jgi:hypothetical protein
MLFVRCILFVDLYSWKDKYPLKFFTYVANVFRLMEQNLVLHLLLFIKVIPAGGGEGEEMAGRRKWAGASPLFVHGKKTEHRLRMATDQVQHLPAHQQR